LGRTLSNVKAISLRSTEFTQHECLVHEEGEDQNNRIPIILETSRAGVAKIPEGNYTSTSLAREIQTQASSLFPNTALFMSYKLYDPDMLNPVIIGSLMEYSVDEIIEIFKHQHSKEEDDQFQI